MTTQFPLPTFYQLDENTVVIDSHAITTLSAQSKQRMLNYLASHYHTHPKCIDAVTADNSLTLYLAPHVNLAELETALISLWQAYNDDDFTPTHHVIEVNYGGQYGEDLAFIAKTLNLTEQEVIAIHSSARYQVDFIGFQPGFAYISGLDERLHLPRRETPRTHVPKGSVAIAANKTAIYPAQSPGGWHLIGHTDLVLFDKNSSNPSLLRPGDMLTFKERAHD